jgi:hypothetical protein
VPKAREELRLKYGGSSLKKNKSKKLNYYANIFVKTS